MATTDPAVKSDRTLHLEEEERREREQVIHAKATRLRSDMSFIDIIDALHDADQRTITEILYAAQNYDHQTLGNEISRQIQKYFRRIADDGYIPTLAKNQAD